MAKGRSRGRAKAPRAVASDRRERRAAAELERTHQATKEPDRRPQTATAPRALGTYGERPQGLFGPVPVSEIAIAAGMVALLVGFFGSNTPALVTGVIICVLGVGEVTAREHFSGFRSHTTLLAAIPAVAAEAIYAFVIGVPSQRLLLLAPVVPVFGLCFWLLRRSFLSARHARVVSPPSR